MLGVFDFTIIPARWEAGYPEGMEVPEAVRYIARMKAEDCALRAPEDALILAADTVVSVDGRILEKPENEEDARRMLRLLSGRQHRVYTGLALKQGQRVLCDCAQADVWFKPLSEAEISAYIATGMPMDKAGAYGAQDMAALFVERIDGEFYTVVGLPMCQLGKLLDRFGVSIWS